jgi:hypothetical protein
LLTAPPSRLAFKKAAEGECRLPVVGKPEVKHLDRFENRLLGPTNFFAPSFQKLADRPIITFEPDSRPMSVIAITTFIAVPTDASNLLVNGRLAKLKE